MNSRWQAAALAIAMGALAAPAHGAPQELAQRIAAVGDGTVRFTYPVREGVEICSQGIRMGDRRMMWHSRGWDEAPESCRTGSAEVEIAVRGGEARGVEILRRASDRTPGAVELGAAPAGEAVRYFLGQARTPGASGDRGDFVFTAYLADVPEVWRNLLGVARDRQSPRKARTSALFWVGQEAAEAATEGLGQVAFAADEEQEVRDAAVFALSQQPTGRAVPLLMELARTAPHAKTRKSALFWLAQSDDERVPAFFEAILLGRGGG